eukprot:1171014-Amphidinium_carterae.1
MSLGQVETVRVPRHLFHSVLAIDVCVCHSMRIFRRNMLLLCKMPHAGMPHPMMMMGHPMMPGMMLPSGPQQSMFLRCRVYSREVVLESDNVCKSTAARPSLIL